MGPADLDVIHAVLNGQIDRYAELVDQYQGPAIRLAFVLLGNMEDARDVSQDAFISAYQSLSRFGQRAAFSTWLYRIVVNKCRDAQRRRARQPSTMLPLHQSESDGSNGSTELFDEVGDPAPSPNAQLAGRELSRRISQAIGTLPMQQRTAFVLHHLHGCSLEEAAAAMTCRIGTVKSHLFRAMEHLRAELSPWLAQEDA